MSEREPFFCRSLSDDDSELFVDDAQAKETGGVEDARLQSAKDAKSIKVTVVASIVLKLGTLLDQSLHHRVQLTCYICCDALFPQARRADEEAASAMAGSKDNDEFGL